MADQTFIKDSQDRAAENQTQEANRSVEAWKDMNSLNTGGKSAQVPDAFGNLILTDGKKGNPTTAAAGSKYYVCPDGTVTFKPDCPKERN